MPQPIATVEEFYAHALAIEREAAARYGEFASHFAAAGDDVLEGLCRNLASHERDHFQELADGCAHLRLPAIDPTEYRWLEGESPEAPARELMYRIATPRQLLEIALLAECRARDFFVSIVKSAPVPSVRELAAVMAAEEVDHVRWVHQALEYYGGAPDWETLMREGCGPGIVAS
jgi:rubrerythrin